MKGETYPDLSFTFEVHQEGDVIATANSGDREDALNEAMRYVHQYQYGGNGPCQVYEVFTQRKHIY